MLVHWYFDTIRNAFSILLFAKVLPNVLVMVLIRGRSVLCYLVGMVIEWWNGEMYWIEIYANRTTTVIPADAQVQPQFLNSATAQKKIIRPKVWKYLNSESIWKVEVGVSIGTFHEWYNLSKIYYPRAYDKSITKR